MAWRGTYQGKERVPTVTLEAIVDHHLWFWHLFFGMPGANNDINILDCSPLFKQHLEGTSPKVTDGIYPDWDLFMKTSLEPNSIKQQHFTEQQEARWKGIECNFGALQVRGLRFLFCFFLL